MQVTALNGFLQDVINLAQRYLEQLLMSESSPVVETVTFGVFELDLRAGELRKRGMKVRLQEKPFQILAALLRRPGEVVTREELRHRLWRSDTFVEFDRSLNTGLSKLREALGDSAENPRFIETLPRRGYRFIAPVGQPKTSPQHEGRRMLAVLPFENLSGDSEQEYFADGLTEELISQLGQLNPRRLGVIARTSANQLKGTKKSVKEIAEDLNVGYVLEGSVRREGSRVRIAAQLITAQDQTHLWSSTYDRELGDILSVQQDVASRVGAALALELLPGLGIQSVAADPAAHEAYLRGRFFWGQRREEALTRAISYFEQAVAIDPKCALAYSGLADCYCLLCWFGALAPREAGPKAAAAAARALELEDSRSEAHASLALVRFWYEWDWKGAEEEFLRAIELNPSYAAAHQWYASFLNSMGRGKEAEAELSRARQSDPLSLIISMTAADPLFYGRQFEQAIEHLRAILELEPRFSPAWFNLGRALTQNGKHRDAIAAFQKAVEYSGNREGYPALAHAHARAGNTAEAHKILDEMMKHMQTRPLAAPLIAHIYLGLGEREQALEWLTKGVEERSFWITMLKVDPIYDDLRADRRFRDLLKRLALDPAVASESAKAARGRA